jgi:hypothetical protein
MDTNSIFLPGSPLNDTIFSDLASSSYHAATYNGTWSFNSEIPYRLSLTLSNYRISLNTAQENAENFINASLRQYLEYVDTLTNDSTRWKFIFSNYTNQVLCLIVQVTINSISGEVIGYEEFWNEEANITSNLVDFYPFKDAELLSASQANSVTAHFIESHNYTLPSTSRYIQTTPMLTDEHLNEFLQMKYNGTLTPDFYEITLSSPVGKVFPDQYSEGIRVKVSASTGRIISFIYDLIIIPLIDIDEVGVLNNLTARNLAAEVHPQPSENLFEWGDATLRFIRLDSYRQQTIQFQLAWTFGITYILFGNIEVRREISVDAISGYFSDLYPGLYFSNPSSIPNFLLILTVIVSGSFAVSGIIVIGYKRKMKQVLQHSN